MVKNNNNVFGVVKIIIRTKNDNINDYKYALQLQQQQLFEAVQVMNDININTAGNNNNTPLPTNNIAGIMFAFKISYFCIQNIIFLHSK